MATPMTPAQMLAVLKAEGLTVKEYPGWKTRCRCCPDSGPHHPAGPFIRGWGNVNGGVQHITGGGLGGRSVETYIRDIILGDPNLPTKCQFVTDPDGVVWLVAAGRANHAGGVGSKVRDHMVLADFSLTDDYDDRFRGSTDDGNAFTYGNEAIAAVSMNAKQRASSVLLWSAIGRFHRWSGQEVAGHGEISSARVKADPNLHMGNFRRDIMARIKGKVTPTPAPPADPPPVVVPAPVVPVVSKPHEYIGANLAGYDKVHGLATAAVRANTIIPDYLLPKAPEWLHFQECSAPMLDAIDRHFGKDYVRIPAGGKGRESLYRRDAGIKILGAKLQNVTHMLDGDTKPHLTTAWEDADGFRGVYVNFHNENDGTIIQGDQLWDVMKHGVAMADKHGIPHANVVFTGDSNLLTARAFVKAKGWLEARDIAKKKIDLIYRTTSDWLNRLVEGPPIDVDVFHKQAVVDEAEMLYGVISDHFARRIIHRLTK